MVSLQNLPLYMMRRKSPDRRQLWEQELTMEELIALINSQKGDFVIRVEFGEEAVSDAKEE